MAKLVIFGTGDIAQIAAYYFKIDSNHEVVAFTVDKHYIKEPSFEGLPVVPFEDIEKHYPPALFNMFIATSYAKLNKVREAKYNEAKAKGYELVSYVSSKCTYLSQYPCGDNCFIFEDNTIQPFVKIGNNVTLWSGNHIGHHSTIADHNFISSHVVISGHCTIGSNSFLGVNSCMHHYVNIAPETIVGAGVIITDNTKKGDVWVPAKPNKLDKKSDQINL